jgi:hypothetical protein
MGSVGCPAGFYYATEANMLGAGFEEFLDSQLINNPMLKLVVIDVLQRIKPTSGQGNAYEKDYNLLPYIKKVADKHSAAILLITHLKKPRKPLLTALHIEN